MGAMVTDHLHSLTVRIRDAGRSSLDASWRAEGYCDPFSRLYLVEEGRAWTHHHGREQELRPGVMHIVPAQSVLSFGCEERFVISWLHFDATLWGCVDLFAWLPAPWSVTLPDAGEALHLLAEARSSFARRTPGSVLKAHGALLQLLAPYADAAPTHHGGGGATSPQRFAAVLNHMERHLADRVPVSELAKVAGLETSYFSSCFRDCFGLPPGTFLRQRRVRRAQELLRSTDLALESIAAQTGFCDAFHLSKAVKAVTGASPRELRRRDAVLP